MPKVGDKIAEIEMEDGHRLYVFVGGMGELNFWTDSIGGGVRIWDTLSGEKGDLYAILDYLEDNPNHIKYGDLEFPKDDDYPIEEITIEFTIDEDGDTCPPQSENKSKKPQSP